jgi:dTMP kinase
MKTSISKKGSFITFEGVDGCGKSTQTVMLSEKLTELGLTVTSIREPGGTRVSESIREILLYRDTDELSARTEALLMTASRSQVTREVIIPALERGEIVIADRYADSTLAYQGGGRNLNIDWLIKLNTFATYELQPDITFLIDISIEEGINRQKDIFDRIEKEGSQFLNDVKNTYTSIANRFGNRIVIVDGHKDKNTIHDLIWQELRKRKIITL